MASYLRPRRGKKATAEAQLTSSAPLKRGEVFFEVPDSGVGTGLGRIKMGDGSTAYGSLPTFLEQLNPDTALVGFTNSTTGSEDLSTNATYASAIVPSANLKTIFTNLKQLLLNHNVQLTKLNNDLASQPHSVVPQSHWGAAYSYYRQVGNATIVNFDIVWGKAITVSEELLSGLPIQPTSTNQINFNMVLCAEDGTNARLAIGAITSNGKIITGTPIAFKERTIGSVVY